MATTRQRHFVPSQGQPIRAHREMQVAGQHQQSQEHVPIVITQCKGHGCAQKDTVPDPQCVSLFWDKYPQAWEHVTTDMEDARVVMADLSDWLSMNAGTYRLKWVAAPANFDWMFLKCYYERYGPPLKYDIGFFCHDLHSLIRAYVTIHRLTDVEQFKDTLAHGHMATHNALDDAVRQGVQYCSIRVLLGSKRQRTNGQPTKHKRVHNSA